jgi:hypothetical protein
MALEVLSQLEETWDCNMTGMDGHWLISQAQ